MNFSAGIPSESAVSALHENQEATHFEYLADDLDMAPTIGRQISALSSANWVGSQSSYSSSDEVSFEVDLMNNKDLLRAPRVW